MTRPQTGETPKRNIRIEDEIWQPALQQAGREGRKLPVVIRAFLARYGTRLPDDAPTRDPWELVNVAMKDQPAGPHTDLDAAAQAAGEVLRALGMRPQVGEDTQR